MLLTEEQKALITSMTVERRMKPTAISLETGIPRQTIQGFLERRDRPARAGTASTVVDTPVPEQERTTLDIPVRPLAVPLPSPAVVSEGPLLTALLWGDVHIPFENKPVLSVVGQIAELLKPTYLIQMGDLMDCYHLSDFDQDPNRMHNLQDEITQARTHLIQMRMRSPDSMMIYLEGNHEERLRRAMWKAKGPMRALMQLDVVRQALTWPSLLGLDELSVRFIPYDSKQAKQKILPKWILKHGTMVRKFAGYTARGEMERYGRSGSSGHTHRLGMHMRSDHNGAHAWLETGCCCSLEPEYMPDPDWQNGAVILTFEPETGAFQAEPVFVHNGLAVWRGRVIRA